MIWFKVVLCPATLAYNFVWITWQIWLLFTWSCIPPQVKGLLVRTKFTLWTFIIQVLEYAAAASFCVRWKKKYSRQAIRIQWRFIDCHYTDIFITGNAIPRMTNDWFRFNQVKLCTATHKNNKHIMHTDAWLAICMINYKQSTCFV